MDKTCSVDECDRPVRSRNATMCEMHYMRMRRNGTLTLTHPQRDSRGVCVITGCDKVDAGLWGLCDMHLTRANRHGDSSVVIPVAERRIVRGPDHPSWKFDDVDYSTVHGRIRNEHGPASGHACVDCSRQAQHWSYNHNDPDERVSAEYGPYGRSIDYYSPRCVSCHKRFDLDHLGEATA